MTARLVAFYHLHSMPWRTLSRPSRFALVLTTLVLIGGGLRFWGIGFGLPFLYHGDEGEIVRRALLVPAIGPNPYWFQYPTLYIYVQAIGCLALFAVAWITGTAANYAEFLNASTMDPTAVYLLGRAFTAGLGTATIATVGCAARACWPGDGRDGSLAGIVAAALIAVNLLHVEHSHYVTPDVPLTLAVSGLLLVIARTFARPGGGSVRQYAIAGVCVGMAASIKYPGALLAAAVVAAWLQQAPLGDPRSLVKDARLPVAALASIAAFLVGSPYVLLNFQDFQRDFLFEAKHMRQGHLGFEDATAGWVQHLGNFHESGGTPLLVFFVIGAGVIFSRRNAFGRTLVISAIVLFVFASRSNVLFARYLLPMLPMVAVAGAGGIVWLAGVLAGKRARLLNAAVAVLLVLCLSLPGYLIFHRLRLFTAADTRTEAWHWIDRTLRPDTERPRIAVEWKSVQTSPVPFAGADAVPLRYDLAALRAAGVRYVVVTDRLYRRYLRAAERYPQQAAFYRDLLDTGSLLQTFSPYAGNASLLIKGTDGLPEIVRGGGGPPWAVLPRRLRAGPVILVFEIPPAASGMPAPGEPIPNPIDGEDAASPDDSV